MWYFRKAVNEGLDFETVIGHSIMTVRSFLGLGINLGIVPVMKLCGAALYVLVSSNVVIVLVKAVNKGLYFQIFLGLSLFDSLHVNMHGREMCLYVHSPFSLILPYRL